MAEEMSVPFLGRIPLDPEIASRCDEGKAFVTSKNEDSNKSVMFKEIAKKAFLNGDSNVLNKSK